MKPIYSVIISLIALVASGVTTGGVALADTTALFNLSPSQVDSVMDTLAADLSFRPLEPASAPKDWGFSGGLTGTVTSTVGLAQQVPGVNTDYIGAANIYAGVQGPFGLGVELGFFPETTIKGFEFGMWGGDIKWNFNQAFLQNFPVDLAVRGLYSHGDVSFSTTNQQGTGEIDYNTSIYGFNLAASLPLLFIFEPYAEVGWIGRSSTLAATANLSVFNQSVSATNSVDGTGSSVWLAAGLQIKLLVLTITGEYDWMFDTNVYALKVGFKI